jgi:hypothetical protein
MSATYRAMEVTRPGVEDPSRTPVPARCAFALRRATSVTHPKRLSNSIRFPARPSHAEGNNCLCLALTLCGREAVQS